MSDGSTVQCLRCQAATQYLGKLPLMTGRSSATEKLFLGQLAEMDERHWDVDVFRCEHCGHVEVFDLSVVAPH